LYCTAFSKVCLQDRDGHRFCELRTKEIFDNERNLHEGLCRSEKKTNIGLKAWIVEKTEKILAFLPNE